MICSCWIRWVLSAARDAC